MAQHSKLAPSAAHRWLNCPASIKLSESFPDTTSVYAAEGTVAHKLSELKLRHSILKEEIKEDDLQKVYHSEFYNQDMEDYTDDYIEYIRSLSQSYATSILVETQLDLDFIAPDTHGIADCILIDGNTLHVIDLKFGKNVAVDAQDNPQLMIYALGACSLLDGLIYNIQNVVIHIAQPRMNNYSTMEITKQDLYKWLNEKVRPQAKKALEGSDEIKSGDWCIFCPAKPICREYGNNFNTEMEPDDPNKLSNKEIAQRIKQLSGLEGYLKELQDYALTHVLDGETFPGFKAVAGRSTRVWSNQEEAFKVAQANGYDHSVLFTQKPLTLAQVEKMMGKKTFKELLSDYVVKPPGKPTLVPEDDPREPLDSYQLALEDFKDIKI